MKTLNSHSLIFYILLLLSIVAGFYIGSVTYRYEIIVKGIMGIATFVLSMLLGFPPKGFGYDPAKVYQIQLPRDIKYIVVGFFLFILMYWSGRYVANLILYLVRFL